MRAIARRARSPPLMRMPCSPSMVLVPERSPSCDRSRPTLSQSSSTRASSMPGLTSSKFSSSVPERKKASWGQSWTIPFHVAVPVSAGDIPPKVMRPPVGRFAPAMRLSRVDFPEPDGPTTATISPERAVRLTEWSSVASPVWEGTL